MGFFNGEGWVLVPRGQLPDAARWLAVQLLKLIAKRGRQVSVLRPKYLRAQLAQHGLPTDPAPTVIPADYAPTVEPAGIAIQRRYNQWHPVWSVDEAPVAQSTAAPSVRSATVPPGLGFAAPFSTPGPDLSGLSTLDRLVASNRLECNQAFHDLFRSAQRIIQCQTREIELTGIDYGEYESGASELPDAIGLEDLAMADRQGAKQTRGLLRFHKSWLKSPEPEVEEGGEVADDAAGAS